MESWADGVDVGKQNESKINKIIGKEENTGRDSQSLLL